MKLSIITPYYNTLEYTKKLAEVLVPQLDDMVEWIIVDDGCHQKELDEIESAIVVHLPNHSGNASAPRNYGLNIAKGDYIAFIDSDDLVENDYVHSIYEKIFDNDDYFYIGWRCNNDKFIIYDEPLPWNTCVWNCVYKRSLIGLNRFDPSINIGEDEKFNKIVRKGKRGNLNKILYIYNFGRDDSLMGMYTNGKINSIK